MRAIGRYFLKKSLSVTIFVWSELRSHAFRSPPMKPPAKATTKNEPPRQEYSNMISSVIVGSRPTEARIVAFPSCKGLYAVCKWSQPAEIIRRGSLIWPARASKSRLDAQPVTAQTESSAFAYMHPFAQCQPRPEGRESPAKRDVSHISTHGDSPALARRVTFPRLPT